MLTYSKFKDNLCRLQAVTSITGDEFQQILPAFAQADAAPRSSTPTDAGHRRPRASGGGRKARLATIEDK